MIPEHTGPLLWRRITKRTFARLLAGHKVIGVRHGEGRHIGVELYLKRPRGRHVLVVNISKGRAITYQAATFLPIGEGGRTA